MEKEKDGGEQNVYLILESCGERLLKLSLMKEGREGKMEVKDTESLLKGIEELTAQLKQERKDKDSWLVAYQKRVKDLETELVRLTGLLDMIDTR